MHKIWVLHGPNLNLLGVREQAHYGSTTLAQIDEQLQCLASKHSINLQCFQHNSEAQFIKCIHHALDEKIDYFIVNPAAFTHTSIALRDALLGVNIPFIEVHLSNIAARESFRHASYFSDIAKGTIAGLGACGYELALQAIIQNLKNTRA